MFRAARLPVSVFLLLLLVIVVPLQARAGFAVQANQPAAASASIVAYAGDRQANLVTVPFAQPLQAKVTDAQGNAVPNAAVSFVAPASGPSATFAFSGMPSTTTKTDPAGLATVYVAGNNLSGTYIVEAWVPGVAQPAAFQLTNQVGSGIWYVAPDGDDKNSCASPDAACATMQGPQYKAAFVSGDTIRVAEGVYRPPSSPYQVTVVVIERMLVLSGGWDRTFTRQQGMSTLAPAFAGQGAIGLEVKAPAVVRRFVIEDMRRGSGEPGIAIGAGLINRSRLRLTDSVIRNNTAYSAGAGVANWGQLLLDRDLIHDNHALRWDHLLEGQRPQGAGIYNAGTLFVDKSTIYGNDASLEEPPSEGGGIYSSGVLFISDSTIAGNTAYVGGGIWAASGVMRNSILADNHGSTPKSCYGGLGSAGYNIITPFQAGGVSGCFAEQQAGDQFDAPLVLGPLQDNGGPSFTAGLLPASPAINKGDAAACGDMFDKTSTPDQRRAPRVGACDIGAHEASIHVKVTATGQKRPGDTMYYQVALSNLGGSVALPAVSLTNVMTTGLTLVPTSLSVSSGFASITDDGIAWTGDVPPTGSVTLSYAAVIGGEILPGAVLTNTAAALWQAARSVDTHSFSVAALTGTVTPTPPASCPVTPTPQPVATGAPPASGSVQPRVGHCVDDGHQRTDTGETFYGLPTFTTGSSPLSQTEVITYTGGLLFRNVQIPRYARITSATLRLYAKYQSAVPLTVVVVGDNRGNSEDFTAYHLDMKDRPRTLGRIPWTLPGKVNGWVDSPSITAVVQEIVNRADWNPGSNLSIMLDPGAEVRYADWYAIDYNTNLAPRLTINWDGVDQATHTPTPSPTATLTATPTLTPTATYTDAPVATTTPTPEPTATATANASKAVYLPLIVR